jgi:uncharacterized membrane protein YeaQ/YmgE (transglycosylase-associated protein family)
MLEIIIIINLVRRLSAMASEKGRARSWGALGALGWIGGQLIGAVVASLLEFEPIAIYATALVCAIVGAVTAYLVVRNLQAGGLVAAYAEYGATAPAPVAANYDPSNVYSPPRGG